MTVGELGRLVRSTRRQQGFRQSELAALADVGTRFLSELENGKSTLELGRTLKVLQALGIALAAAPRDWRHIEGEFDV